MAIETTQIYKNLYNSELCRLCGEQNSNGTPLYEDAYDEVDIITLINIYLPVKISDDGKYPKRICPGCHLQVESTAQFFDLLLLGQEKLRALLKHEVDEHKKIQKSQSLLKIDCKEPEELPSNNDYMIIEEKPLFGVDHKLSMKCEGIEKPRRKRGRPPRPPPEELEAQRLEQIALLEEKIKIKQEAESDIEDENGQRKKRRIKIPSRFQEVVQGKELEKILAEEGVIDKLEFSDAEDTTEDGSRKLDGDFRNEIIGHLQGNDGINIGDLVFIKSPKRGRKNYNRKGRTKLLCDICNKEFFHEYRFMKHRASHSNARFECTECLTEFSERKHLTDHQQITNHKGEGVIESMDLTQEPYKVGHYTPNNDDENCSDEGERPYAAATTAVDELNDSIISEKENQPILPESTKSELNEEFIKMGNGLEQSLVDIVQTKLQCDICLREFNHQGSLMYHKESQHNKNRKFICSKCGKSFSHRLLLQRHQKAHSNDRPFECNFCHAKFKSKSNLKNHRLKHSGDKNYPCNVCQQKFTHRNSLITHMRLHSGEKPYKCNVCDKKFTQNGNLNEHMRTHTGERPFKCTHCERTFTTSSQCKSHIKKHIGERPFVCEICDKRFLYLEIYKTHLRRHNGEKPFSCSICKKGFADNWGLRKHQRFHTGEKPYPCEFCGKHFADCSNLKKHKANNCTLRFTIKPTENTELSYTNELPEEEPNHCEQEISITQPTTDHIEEIIRNSSSPPPLALATYTDPRNNSEIIQCKPIIYLTYQSTMTNEINQTCNHNPINSITEIDPITGNELALVNSNDTITTHQYFNDTILNQITDDGSCHDPMIITMTKDDSDENVDCITTENILQLAHNGSDLLYQIQSNDGMVENYGDSQQIEYITVEGRRLRLVNYADPIDLESPFIIS